MQVPVYHCHVLFPTGVLGPFRGSDVEKRRTRGEGTPYQSDPRRWTFFNVDAPNVKYIVFLFRTDSALARWVLLR